MERKLLSLCQMMVVWTNNLESHSGLSNLEILSGIPNVIQGCEGFWSYSSWYGQEDEDRAMSLDALE